MSVIITIDLVVILCTNTLAKSSDEITTISPSFLSGGIKEQVNFLPFLYKLDLIVSGLDKCHPAF